jgi:hypothetical protein
MASPAALYAAICLCADTCERAATMEAAIWS